MSAADELHESVFGFIPAKAGTAYERLAAVVLAELGWVSVEHQAKLRPEGRRATQRLDVTAKHPDGSIRRLLVECKDWNEDVGKGTIDALVGVRKQAGFDAAMAVTTKGFTAGAVDVAVDENIAMVILREVRPEDRFVMGFKLEITPWETDWSEVQFLAAAGEAVADGQSRHLDPQDHLLRRDGTPAETSAEVFESQSAGWEEGVFEREHRFEGGRLLPTGTGEPIPIIGVRWTETVSKATPFRSESRETGKPCLVVEQLDENGKGKGARLMVDRHLFAWRITEDGKVIGAADLA